MSEINTTPLVDVMLVLLIIFLITIPVITKTVPVVLPKAVNIPTVTKPENITIRWTRTAIFIGTDALMADRDALIEKIGVRPSRCPSLRSTSAAIAMPVTKRLAECCTRFNAAGL